MNKKALGIWMVMSALALAVLATAGRAEDGSTGDLVAPGGVVTQPATSPTKGKLDDASGGAPQTAVVVDGSQVKPGTPVVDAAGGQNPPQTPDDKSKKQDKPATAGSDLGSPQTANAKGLVPPPPPAPKGDPTVPAQDGDKPDKPGFWDSTKGIMKSVGTMTGQVGGFGGMMVFLFGVATFNPALMLGGALASCGAVLIGGLAQAYL